MTDIKLDEDTHDIDLTNGGEYLVTNQEVVGQRIKVAILLRRKEWFPNINKGVPYGSKFFREKNNKGFIDSFLRNYILKVEDVSRLITYESEVTPDRRLVINFQAQTPSGVVDLGTEV